MRRILAGAVVGTALMVAACGDDSVVSPNATLLSTAPTTPAPSASPSHGPIGRLPDDCEPGPDPVPVSDQVGHGIGGDPAWAIGFGPDATLGFDADDPHQDHGWLRKVLWLLRRTSADPVTVTGWRVGDDSPLWFAYPGPGQEISLVLDPATPDGQHGDWYEYRGYFVIPSAGCYRLAAAWPGGGWELDLRAGLGPAHS